MRIKALLCIVAPISLIACSSVPPIQPVSSSKSAFDGALYTGESATITTVTPGNTEYRVFNQASTGFVSAASVRSDAEQRATEFCSRKDKTMNPLRETVGKPPFILGNFPKIEIIFECAVKPSTNVAGDDPKYTKLTHLKTLLDSGVLTREEFDREKAKILAE